MKVETYEVVSVDEQNGAIINEEVSEEALALIETLDLGGQRALLDRRNAGGEEVSTRMPYRMLTQEEGHVFRAIFPKTTSIEDYDQAPIPLRVLQVAAHAKSMFDDLEVWHPEDARDRDPLLIGERKNPEKKYETQWFILARWGDVLVPFEELREKARKIVLAKLRAKIAEAKAEINALETMLEPQVDGYLLGQSLNGVYVTIAP